jgi:2'-5' RNA ligase
LLRTFFAIEIGDGARRAAQRWIDRLRGEPWSDAVRWTRAEAMHVTLRFLGATPEDRVGPLTMALQREAAALEPFTVQLGALAELAGAAERAALAAGFAPETRPFRGHLTLGRRREHRRRLRIPDGERSEAAPFAVASVVLFRSQLSSAGSTYTPLERIALGGVASP